MLAKAISRAACEQGKTQNTIDLFAEKNYPPLL
jgi:hypothetical protein